MNDSVINDKEKELVKPEYLPHPWVVIAFDRWLGDTLISEYASEGEAINKANQYITSNKDMDIKITKVVHISIVR